MIKFKRPKPVPSQSNIPPSLTYAEMRDEIKAQISFLREQKVKELKENFSAKFMI